MKKRVTQPLTTQAKNVLGRYGWLATQDDDIKHAMFDIGELRTVESGKTLYTVGDTDGSLHAIVSGWQDALVSPWTETPMLMHVSGLGGWGGGLRFASKSPRRVTFVTRTQCQIAFFNESDLKAISAQIPKFSTGVSYLLTLYSDLLISIIAAQAERKASNRVRLTLLRILGEGHETNLPNPIALPLGHADIAEMSLLTRNVVGPILKRLEQLGAIKQGYRSIQVLDRSILRTLD